jgi:hypothetical protein
MGFVAVSKTRWPIGALTLASQKRSPVVHESWHFKCPHMADRLSHHFHIL